MAQFTEAMNELGKSEGQVKKMLVGVPDKPMDFEAFKAKMRAGPQKEELTMQGPGREPYQAKKLKDVPWMDGPWMSLGRVDGAGGIPLPNSKKPKTPLVVMLH